MGKEIERKFTLRNDSWKSQVVTQITMRQGYLATGLNNDQLSSVRIRVAGNQANINIKSAILDIVRDEYEYEIPLEDANKLLDTLCVGPIIEKTRYLVPFQGKTWEVDVFGSDNKGLELAEVELQSKDEAVILPDWVDTEVSDDKRYYNNYLSGHPYKDW